MRLGDPTVLAYVDRLEGRAFERFLAELLRKMGYEAELTPHFDHGADIVILMLENGPTVRAMSPPSFGFSTLMTSAPRSARYCVPHGPAPYCSTDRTRTP